MNLLDAPSAAYYLKTRYGGSQERFDAAARPLSEPGVLQRAVSEARDALKPLDALLQANAERFVPAAARAAPTPTTSAPTQQAHAAADRHQDQDQDRDGPFFGGYDPIHLDFAVFGTYAWTRIVPALASGAWEDGSLPHLTAWLGRMRRRLQLADKDFY